MSRVRLVGSGPVISVRSGFSRRASVGTAFRLSVFWTLASCLSLAIGVQVVAQNRPATPAPARPLTREQTEFFESRIRPIFADNCYQCHSGNAPVAGLELDWKGGWEQGSLGGAVVVPGNPDQSKLINAVRYANADLQMPPDGKLTDAQIGDLVSWVRMGAPDPRTTRPGGAAQTYGGRGKDHWAFQALTKANPPSVRNAAWVKNDVDRFVLAKLEAGGMTGNEMADKRTLIRRAYFDLIGLPPTPEQVQAFIADSSPNAFEKVVDGLLASPHYGERWGRHWLDVARYADSKGQNDRRRESSIYPYAWTYRDYVIDSFNRDLPYDQFIREQLAADRVSPKDPRSWAALGFLTLGDHFNGMASDVINDRIDVTTKAFLGLTVTCARCHDHKFDPIPTADYYSLYGIFSSSLEAPDRLKPVILQPNAANASYLTRRKAMDDRIQALRDQNMKEVFGDYRRLGGVYLLATTMPARDRDGYLKKNGADPSVMENWTRFTRQGGRAAVAFFGVWNALARIPAGNFQQRAPRVLANQFEKGRVEQLSPLVLQAVRGKTFRYIGDVAELYGNLLARTDEAWEESFSAVISDAVLRFQPPRNRNQYFQLREQSDMLEMTDAGAPARANVLVDSPTPKDSPIFIRGQAESPGQVVPRRFLSVLSGTNRPTFKNGSGRLELANAIANKSNPLTARVMVNRVWQYHFGDGFVSTPDDLGNQSAPPTHPELLDWLANRFMADNWSVKKLHKVILLSASWQQSTRHNPQYAERDPFNDLLWRANVRRLEFEPLRDSILAIGGGLDRTIGGHPIDLSGGLRPPQNNGRGAGPFAAPGAEVPRLATTARRSIYGFIDRGDLADVLSTFDFPSSDSPFGKRFETIVPQQALFLMNSPLVIEQVRAVVNRDAFQRATSDDERVQMLYELYFQRPPTAEEVRVGRDFVAAYRPANAQPPPPTDPATPGFGGRGRGRGGLGQPGAAGQPGQPGQPGQGRGGPGRGRGAFGPQAPPAPVRQPLTAWQEYAHALLLTNEAAFVN